MKAKYIIIGFLLASFFYGCEDSLDTKTTYEIDDPDVWRIPELAEGVLIKAYAGIANRPDHFDENFLDCATDNALTNTYSSKVYKASMGGITAVTNPLDNWSESYAQLQNVNLFLENGLSEKTFYNLTDPNVDKQIKQRLKGEAHFLRAWWHFELLRMYGGKAVNGKALGIPIADKYITQEEAGNFENFVRASYADCADFIVDDLDLAIDLLPEAYKGADVNLGASHIGRATKMAALVLKSRVILYASSPATQDDDVTQITGMGQYNVIDQSAYAQNWEKAAITMDDILSTSGFGDFIAMQASHIADGPNTTPADFVFRRYFNNNLLETNNFPPFYYGSARTVPSHNLMRAFPKKDGFPQSGALGSTPYDDLDNRFMLIFYYHGLNFGDSGTPLDMRQGGKDSQEFHPDGSRSGYYLSKFVSKNSVMLNPIKKANAVHYNPLLRKSEVFLNYAEAANEAWGPYGTGTKTGKSAYDIIKDIRLKSGGITDVTYLDQMALSKDDFRKLIQNERRMEFAFEDHRYFDMRRCVLLLNEDIFGVTVKDDGGGNVIYTEQVVEKRLYDVRHYFAPIPYSEIKKNKNLINNKGWE